MYSSDSPLEALLGLFIDDGVPSRGHRTNIMSPNFYYMGSATAMHKVYRSETVIDYSGSYNKFAFTAPEITVPTTAAAYKGFSNWNTPA